MSSNKSNMSTLKVCLPHKRKRGRPRADEPKDMKDFDLALIHEFKRRPAFYDRTHPQYRNREHLDPQWTVLAHTLGYTVPVVKNRMMQLRSRYSLEKRRLEAVKEQCGEDAEITSPWALYDEMDFLGEHIKGRLPTLKKEGGDSMMQSSDSEDNEDSNATGPAKLVNGYTSSQSIPNNNTSSHQHNVASNRNIASPPNSQHVTSVNHNSDNDYITPHTGGRHEKVLDLLHLSSTDSKFVAFGQFVSSSLIEMQEPDALRLVEKFTSELIQTLQAERFSNNTNNVMHDST